MKQEINVYDFERAFKEMDRDYFSYEGYQALYDYYDEFPDFELDVIAICCDVTEYNEDDLLNDYSYLLDREKDLEDDEYLEELVKELRQHTNIIELDNGSFLVWEF